MSMCFVVGVQGFEAFAQSPKPVGASEIGL